jgi:pre-mRNA-processing factor SLU7
MHLHSSYTKTSSVYINNHTQIWGSWYDVRIRQWGYACCRGLIHASYCTGQAGIEAAEASSHAMLLKMDKVRIEQQRKEEEATAAAAAKPSTTSKRLGDGEIKLDSEKLAQAIREERKRKAADFDDRYGGDKKRRHEAGMDIDVTEEELGKFPHLNRR